MYQDLKKFFWWPKMKEITQCVASYIVCQKTKIKHQKSSGMLQPLYILDLKWDSIVMNF